jgi:hypothetical protein
MRHCLLTLSLLLAGTACTEPATPITDCDLQAALASTPQWTGACASAEVDWADARCHDANYQVPLCAAATVIDGGEFGAQHIALPLAITYADSPPMSGPHRGEWPFWGEYAFAPKERWLHSLEHGGIALLYHPCAPKSLVDALRSWAQSVEPDSTGAFRWVLTPYPGLDSAFSLVAWKHRLKGNCFLPADATQFKDAHYRKAPEDEGYEGSYGCTWFGRSCGMSTGAAVDVDASAPGGIHRDAE